MTIVSTATAMLLITDAKTPVELRNVCIVSVDRSVGRSGFG